MGKKNPQTLLANWNKPEQVKLVLSKRDSYIYSDVTHCHPNYKNGVRTVSSCTGSRGDLNDPETRRSITAMYAGNNPDAETFIRLEDGTLQQVKTLTL